MKKDCPVCLGNMKVWVRRSRDLRFLDDGFYGVSSVNRYRIWHCLKCGFSLVDPRVSEKDLNRVYESYYTGVSDLAAFKRNYRRLDILKRYCPHGGCLLDVGAGHGAFASLAKADFKVLASDSSEAAVEHCRKLGIKAVLGTIRELPNINGEFDVVTCWDVLEHLKDPLNSISLCLSKVKPKGFFVASTPDTKAIVARLFRRWWSPFYSIEHLCFFSKKSLKMILESNGFIITSAFYENATLQDAFKWLRGVAVFAAKYLILLSCNLSRFSKRKISQWYAPFIPMWRDNLVIVARRLR